MLRFKHHLASADNFEYWKLRIMMLLKENKLESFIKEEKEEPKDDLEKTLWIENNEKAIQIIVNFFPDHIVPIVSKHKTKYHMFKGLENASIVNNIGRGLSLKRQMNHISMNKGESVNDFFVRIIELRDQFFSVGYKTDNQELSLIALGGLPNSWEPFVQGISTRSKLSNLD